MSVNQTQDQTRTRPEPIRRRDRFGGVPGNERLTAEMGAVLFVLLAVLGLTIPMVRSLMYEHVFLGMLLIPPVALKLASTGYRFVRGCTKDPAYRLAGQPAPLERVIAPLVVAGTLAVFRTTASCCSCLARVPGSGRTCTRSRSSSRSFRWPAQ